MRVRPNGMPANILYISNFSDAVGGGEISLLAMLENVDREKYSPTLLLPEKGGMEQRAVELDVPCVIQRMPGLKNPLSVLQLPFRLAELREIIKKSDIDLIHVNTSLRPALYAGLAARAAGVPAVWHVRVMGRESVLDRAVFSLFSKVIANSGATAARFDGFPGAESKVIVIHNAVDTRAFKPGPPDEEPRRRFGAGPDDLLIGIAGRIHDWKGHEHFIAAAGKLAAAGRKNLRFVIVGEGPYLEECRKFASASPAAGWIHFAGRRDDMPAVMNSLDILVLASDAEHFGRVVIEAMACGKPVVATNAGGVPEIIDGGVDGLLTPPRDADAIAEAISRLADSPRLRENIGKAALEKVEAKFAIRGHISRIQNVYESILNK